MNKSIREKVRLFSRDKIVRDKEGRPLGRAVLLDKNYKIGEKIPITILDVSKSKVKDLIDTTFYIDDFPYKIQKNISKLKVRSTSIRYMINNFYMEPAKNAKV